jgi:hypothetical protein
VSINNKEPKEAWLRGRIRHSRVAWCRELRYLPRSTLPSLLRQACYDNQRRSAAELGQVNDTRTCSCRLTNKRQHRHGLCNNAPEVVDQQRAERVQQNVLNHLRRAGHCANLLWSAIELATTRRLLAGASSSSLVAGFRSIAIAFEGQNERRTDLKHPELGEDVGIDLRKRRSFLMEARRNVLVREDATLELQQGDSATQTKRCGTDKLKQPTCE